MTCVVVVVADKTGCDDGWRGVLRKLGEEMGMLRQCPRASLANSGGGAHRPSIIQSSPVWVRDGSLDLQGSRS